MAEPALIIDLDRAIAGTKLVLRYQPIVAVGTGTLVGVEALLRRNDRDGPEVPPREIVAAAEASGRIRPLTFWVLREALLQSSVWRADGVPTTVGVNLSLRNLHDRHFRRYLDLALKVAGTPELLVVELASASVASDPLPPLATIDLMRERGIRVALDDVGSGDRTLRDLRAIPADIVKLGRRLVSLIAHDDDALATRAGPSRGRTRSRLPRHRRWSGGRGHAAPDRADRLRFGPGLRHRPADERDRTRRVAKGAMSRVAVLCVALVVACAPPSTGAPPPEGAVPSLSSAPAPTPATATRAGPASAAVEVVVRGLDTPWALAFAPDGRIFVTERGGRVRVVQNGALQQAAWATIPVVARSGSESGLLGLALDPDFARNGFVYIAYTFTGGTGRTMNRLSRFREDGAGRGVEEKVLLDGALGNTNHDGGRVKFGPDGKLWWTMGDAGNDRVAQDAGALNGKILRLEKDGSVPADNPFPSSYVYSYGHRNPQGLAWHPDTRVLYETEHGPSGLPPACCHDEVNLIEPGANYGWPTVYGIARDPRFRDPLLESGATETWAPSGAAFVTSGPFRGSFVFATLAGRHLHRVVFGADGRTVVVSEKLLNNAYGRLRDVVEGPDGLLYVLTSNRDGRGSPTPDDDRLLRVTLK